MFSPLVSPVPIAASAASRTSAIPLHATAQPAAASLASVARNAVSKPPTTSFAFVAFAKPAANALLPVAFNAVAKPTKPRAPPRITPWAAPATVFAALAGVSAERQPRTVQRITQLASPETRFGVLCLVPVGFCICHLSCDRRGVRL